MALSSPAFALNGAIPAQYTCDGADVSPPLQWQNLPAHTVELVLFVIDDSSIGAQGGIRWVVAGIDPSLSGIAANSLPSGAIVGLNGAGKASYGGICPAKGKAAAVQFVLWALSKKISLSSGFVPGVAEREYSNSELGSAVTYATYTRK
jgi:Raf kinase inhibitor-like YbhB/YbcL family protein